MRFDQNNPILPTDAITSELLEQYIAQHTGPTPKEKQLAVGKPFSDAINGAPEFAAWGADSINQAVVLAMQNGHPEKALQTIFALAILVGWELAQLHIDNQMKATELT